MVSDYIYYHRNCIIKQIEDSVLHEKTYEMKKIVNLEEQIR